MPTLEFPHGVIQILPALNSGGAEQSALQMSRAIVAAGGRSVVVSSGGRLADRFSEHGAHLVTAPAASKNPLVILSNARLLERLFGEFNVGLIHARSRAPAWSAYIAGKRLGLPVVTTFHGLHEAKSPLKRFYNSGLVRGQGVIANSQFTAERIKHVFPTLTTPVRIIPRGVDLDQFQPDRVDGAHVNHNTAKWPMAGDENSIRFLLPARLTRWKGQEIAIEAFAALNSRMSAGKGKKLTLVLCGGASKGSTFEADLRAQIDRSGVGEMVQLVGEWSDMPAAYAWSDIVLAPSIKPEPFGRTAIEAAAMKRPVIVSDHGGARESVIDQETGWRVNPGDTEALADAMAEAADLSLEKRIAMGEAARALCERSFSETTMTTATLQFYQEVMAKRV